MIDTYSDFYSDPFLNDQVGDPFLSDKAFKKIGCFVKVVAAFWIAFYAAIFVGILTAIYLAWQNFG